MQATLSRLVSGAGAVVDRAALLVMQRAFATGGDARTPADARTLLERVAEAYGRPEHFADPDSFFRPPPLPTPRTRQVRELPGGGAVWDLEWRSSYEPFLPSYRDEHQRYAANLIAHARWYRLPRPRAALVALHGWGGGTWAFEERAFVVRTWLRAGLDVVLFQLPFHGRRTPRGTRSGLLFPSSHVVRTNEAFAQTIFDLRALAALLADRDLPTVGAIGMSLGGYATALWASVTRDLGFAVPMIPAVSFADLLWRHGEGSRARRRAEERGVSHALLQQVFRVHAPLERAPLVPHDARFIIAGRGDRITPPDQAERLWQHWDRPSIHWFPGGHLAQTGRGDAFRALRRFLVERGFATPRSPHEPHEPHEPRSPQ